MGAQTILHGVSLAVPEGSIVTVLGSNGVGKTTLMRALSGVYRVSSGTIRLMGEDITGLPSHAIVRRGLAQAPEGRQIFGAMTVAENLRLGAVGAVDPALLEQVLGMFPILRERYRQRAGSLSGGEQQMLCVGRALMARPKLLLMDEPSLGLAPKLVKQIFDLIVTIRCEGTPVLLVEQNARAALAIADYAYVMDGGRIVLEGPARELARDDRVKAAYLGGHAHA
ncbi:ABC transporter ATP-binding protein [Elioraea tepida]|uniref:ABC transporter ATP-binding protein n=2 Tax=Elioraea tepida TaxID=2843330 RepID=A0A975U488_9PROT|nr:ABC transporter ATP-binding protein [Elioraea tepida]